MPLSEHAAAAKVADPMKLFDLLSLHEPAVTPATSKVHLATSNGQEQPFDVYRQGGFEAWQRWQSKRAFGRPFIVSLVKIPQRADRWLFAGCFRSLGCRPHPERAGHWLYDTAEVEVSRPLAGRAIIHFERTGRQSVRRGEVVRDFLKVLGIREQPVVVERFKTYSAVCLSKSELDLIVRHDVSSWRAALSAVSAVYVITDTRTGKLYVGSATGDGGLWQRWRCYSETGHGGNDKLVELLAREGLGRAASFQFSILEIVDRSAPPGEVLRREQHWKHVLQSHVHGYNLNA